MASERNYTTSTTVLHEQRFKDEVEEEKAPNIQVIKLKPKVKKVVKWTEDTIDNEHMNKLKSNGLNKYSLELSKYFSLLYLSQAKRS